MAAPDFWNDPEASSRQSQELKNLKDDVAQIDALDETYADIEAYIELGNEEEDPETAAEAKELFEGFVDDFETLRVKTLLSGEYDRGKRHRDAACRGRRDGGLRLDFHALPHVYPLGGGPWLFR